MTTNKAEQLRALALKRKQAVAPCGCRNVADFYDGRYDCDFVSPYSKGACNLASPILLILQDWVSEEKLSGPFLPELAEYGRLPSLPTNKKLNQLLEKHLQAKFCELYATNVFPFIKHGRMSSVIPRSQYDDAARTYAIPQIEILQPKLAVALGLNCFNALRRASNVPACRRLGEAIASPFDLGATRVWCQAHPGSRGQQNRGSLVDEDWAAMVRWFRQQ